MYDLCRLLDSIPFSNKIYEEASSVVGFTSIFHSLNESVVTGRQKTGHVFQTSLGV